MGALGFVLFTAAGIGLVIWWRRPTGLAGALGSVRTGALALLILLAGLDWVLGGLRYRLFFAGGVLPRISLWRCMKSNWANLFMGVVTPAQTGGGAAQLYLLWRYGARLSEAGLVSLINLAATFSFFAVGGALALVLLPADLLGPRASLALAAPFVLVGALAGLIGLMLLFPARGVAWVRRAARWSAERAPRLGPLANRLTDLLDRELRHFRTTFRAIVQRSKATLLLAGIATIALALNKYVLGYVVASSFQDGVPFAALVGLQIVQHLLLYFSPTPGASGVAEASSAWLMAGVLRPEVLLLWVLVWRFLTITLGALIGFGVLVADVRAWARGSAARRVVETRSSGHDRLAHAADRATPARSDPTPGEGAG